MITITTFELVALRLLAIVGAWTITVALLIYGGLALGRLREWRRARRVRVPPEVAHAEHVYRIEKLARVRARAFRVPWYEADKAIALALFPKYRDHPERVGVAEVDVVLAKIGKQRAR